MNTVEVNKNERNRVFVLFVIIALWVLLIGTALVKTQVLDYGKNIAKVRAQSNRTLALHPKRGTIYDNQGEVLAISVKAKSAFLNNKNKGDSFRLFNRVRRTIPLKWKAIKDIRKRIKRADKFIWIKRKLTDREYERLAKIKVKTEGESALDFIEEYKRIYPQVKTASHILGGVGIDEQGLYGLEYSTNEMIKGKGCEVKVERDAKHRVYKFQHLTRPTNGKDIHLTIDSSVQFFVEKELKDVVKKYKARSGSVVVMDCHTGAILAMATYPDFDPGNIRNLSPNIIKNRAISFLYDPGSTFKIIVASNALNGNICSPQQVFNCHNGSYKVRDRTIPDDHAYDRLSFEEVVIFSSNIGAAKIGERLGKKRLFQGIRKFGFGQKIGISLPGEEKGILHPVNAWSGVSLQFLSFGYEINVTPIQMTRAFNVLASGGFLVEPYIIKEIDGVPVKRKPDVQILSPGTVQRMKTIMMEVVKKGTGKKARIAGIDIAGKTGTTKKTRRRSKRRKYVSSFGGFFPAMNPKVTMFVVIDEPKGAFYGGDVAAPLFKSIADRLLIYLNIFPELDNKNEIKL